MFGICHELATVLHTNSFLFSANLRQNKSSTFKTAVLWSQNWPAAVSPNRRQFLLRDCRLSDSRCQPYVNAGVWEDQQFIRVMSQLEPLSCAVNITWWTCGGISMSLQILCPGLCGSIVLSPRQTRKKCCFHQHSLQLFSESNTTTSVVEFSQYVWCW